MTIRTSMLLLLFQWTLLALPMTRVSSYSLFVPSPNENFDSLASSGFSLVNYQKACALEASQSLDASRQHFQILFVDDDNAKGRIAEGLLARVAEYNDAMCVLFPASATISSSRNAPRDAAPAEWVKQKCQALGLCPSRSETMGTDFDLTYLDEYDLIVVLTEEIRSLILRSLPTQEDSEYYRPRIRLVSEFLSPDFVTSSMTHENCEEHCKTNTKAKSKTKLTTSNAEPVSLASTLPSEAVDQEDARGNVILNMLDSSYQQRVAPHMDQVLDRSSNLFVRLSARDNDQDWAMVEAGLILAAGGITRFCLSTIEAQFESALEALMMAQKIPPTTTTTTTPQTAALTGKTFEEWDYQLCKCNSVVTGYFSPAQRRARLEKHIANLHRGVPTSSTGSTMMKKDGMGDDEAPSTNQEGLQ